MPQLFSYSDTIGPAQAPAQVTVAYETQGALNAAGDNCVLLPGYYTSTCASYRPWVGPNALFDPARWFVVSCGLLGGGESTFQFEAATAQTSGSAYATIADNVRAQHALLAHLGVRRVRLVAGWSMGGMQAFDWATRFPAFVDACLPVCATATCHPVNQAFLLSVKSLLERADGTIDASDCAKRRFGRVYATWAYDDAFFNEGTWRACGYESAAAVLDGWADDHAAMDAHALYRTLLTWLNCTTSPKPAADPQTRPRLVALPSTSDRYFRVADAKADAALAGGCMVPLSSDLGHVAGRPGIRPQETEQIARCVRLLLD